MAERHVTWHSFHASCIAPGAPALHPIAGTPGVSLFVDSKGGRIGLRTAKSNNEPIPSPLASVASTLMIVEGAPVLEVSTRVQALYQPFFHMMLELADRIQLDGLEAGAAVRSVLEDWSELLSGPKRMTPEEQLGLLAELWTLERLLAKLGVEAMKTWVGPYGEPHDFRRGLIELEVKATLQNARMHRISGLLQLAPTAGNELFVLSLQFERAGTGGTTLPEAVGRVRALLSADSRQTLRFQRGLRANGYFDEDAESYAERYQLRTKPALIAIDDACPRVTVDGLKHLWPTSWHRITDLKYTLNLEGLGVGPGSAEFARVLPELE